MKRAEILADMPVGLERAIMSVLLFHVGIENRISKQYLISQLASSGFAVGSYTNIQRKVGVAVSELRKAGFLICSNSSGRGYWIAKNAEEINGTINEFAGRGSECFKVRDGLIKGRDEKYKQQTPAMINSTGKVF